MMVAPSRVPALSKRIDRLAWEAVYADLWRLGYGRLGPVLSAAECRRLRALYVSKCWDRLARSLAGVRVDRAHHGVRHWPHFRLPS